MAAAFELIDGVPNYNLYVGGKWIRSSRNEAAESRNPATGELFAKVQQAGAAETELAISAARFTLEMGGKSPLIVLGDADVDYAVRAAAFGIFFHQGQVRMANSRILVEEPISTRSASVSSRWRRA